MNSISNYVELIRNLPEREHSFRSSKTTWNKGKYTDKIELIFMENEKIELSRNDVFSNANDLEKLILSTIIWGYPSGMRKDHFNRIMENFDNLVDLLNNVNINEINNFKNHFEKDVKSINGLGLSTYSKFLYFLDVKVDSYPALILDSKIIRCINENRFIELKSLKNITYNNAYQFYSRYNKKISEISNNLNINNSGKIEMFLFQYGLNIKSTE
jgi:hypothetical protein